MRSTSRHTFIYFSFPRTRFLKLHNTYSNAKSIARRMYVLHTLVFIAIKNLGFFIIELELLLLNLNQLLNLNNKS